jgi:hypothetical protein
LSEVYLLRAHQAAVGGFNLCAGQVAACLRKADPRLGVICISHPEAATGVIQLGLARQVLAVKFLTAFQLVCGILAFDICAGQECLGFLLCIAIIEVVNAQQWVAFFKGASGYQGGRHPGYAPRHFGDQLAFRAWLHCAL